MLARSAVLAELKMRLPLSGLRVDVEGERAPDPPRRYTRVRLAFEAEGLDRSDRDKLQRALELSRQTYCSVLQTFREDVEWVIEARLA
jgi:putative redox protein